MISFLHLFHDISLKNPAAAAVIDMEGKRTTSYGDLDTISGRIASYLLKLGIGRESVVVINCGRGMELIAARLGIMKAGAAFVCVEDMLGQERIDYIYKDCKAVLIFDRSHFDRAMEIPPLSFERWVDAEEHDLAFIVYTSGSTGKPKGSAQEYGIYDSIIKGTRPMAEDYLPAAFGNIIPESYVGGIYITVGALTVGAAIHELPLYLVRNQKELLSYFDKHAINVTFMPPTLAKALLSTGLLKLSVLHMGGEIASDVYTGNFDITSIYGATEFGYPTCIFKLDRSYDNTPVGRPLEGTKWILVDDDGQINEKEGVFCINLPYFRGYLNSDDDNCFFIKDGIRYFRSNDFASCDNGVLTIHGRDDEMIKLNGNRVDPSEVEAAVKKVTGAEFAVCKALSRGGVRFLCVYIPEGLEIDRENTLNKLKNILPEFMLPSCFVGIKDLPKNTNGKVDRNALPDPDIKDIFAVYAEPENDLQRKLCALFEEILEINDRKIGIDDSFFLLGGSSLLAMKLLMDADIPSLTFRMLYENRTVRNIDNALKKLKAPASGHSFPPEGLPLTDMQKDYLELQLKYPDSFLFNFGFLLDFKPDTDVIKLKDAVNKAFKAHPGLAVTIMKKGYEWRQYMCPAAEDVCPVTEISGKELKKEIISFLKPPSFDGTPMCRFSIVKSPGKLMLLTDISHLICDGTSLRNLTEDIISIYNGADIEPDPYYEIIQDILKHEEDRHIYRENNMSEMKAWDLLMRLPRPDKPGEISILENITREIGFDKKSLIKAAVKFGTSVGTVFMTAAALTLSKINSTDTVLMSWIWSGRDSVAGIRSAGMFLGTCPVLFSFGGKKTLRSVISDVSIQVMTAIKGGTPGSYCHNKDEKMMVFNYRGALYSDLDSDLVIDADGIDVGGIPAIDPFGVIIDDDESEGMRISIDYDAGLYLMSTVESFIDIFLDELKGMITQHP